MSNQHPAAQNGGKTYNNFVAPYRDEKPQIVEVEIPRELPGPPMAVLLPQAGYEDRSKGFVIATAPVAGIFGFVAALIGVIAWQIPIASLLTLLLALGGFAAIWLCAFVLHIFVSPDGTMFLHTILAWGYLGREQRERFKRYNGKGRGQ